MYTIYFYNQNHFNKTNKIENNIPEKQQYYIVKVQYNPQHRIKIKHKRTELLKPEENKEQ